MERLELLDDKLRKIKSYDLTMMKYARNFIVGVMMTLMFFVMIISSMVSIGMFAEFKYSDIGLVLFCGRSNVISENVGAFAKYLAEPHPKKNVKPLSKRYLCWAFLRRFTSPFV